MMPAVSDAAAWSDAAFAAPLSGVRAAADQALLDLRSVTRRVEDRRVRGALLDHANSVCSVLEET